MRYGKGILFWACWEQERIFGMFNSLPPQVMVRNIFSGTSARADPGWLGVKAPAPRFLYCQLLGTPNFQNP